MEKSAVLFLKSKKAGLFVPDYLKKEGFAPSFFYDLGNLLITLWKTTNFC